MSRNPRHGTAKSPSGMGRKTQSSAQFSGWRSGSFTDLLSAKMGARQRSNSTPDLRESAAEQKRLYEELPFQALPGMRTKSLTRVKSLASMRRNESFMGRMRGDSVVSTGIQVGISHVARAVVDSRTPSDMSRSRGQRMSRCCRIHWRKSRSLDSQVHSLRLVF